MHIGQPPLNREGSNLALKGAQGGVPQHEECLDLRVRHRCKDAVERGGLAHDEAVQRHRQRLGCLFQRFPGARVVCHAVEHRDAGDPRQRLLQPFQLFQSDLAAHGGDARDIAPWACLAGHELTGR